MKQIIFTYVMSVMNHEDKANKRFVDQTIEVAFFAVGAEFSQ